MASEFVTEPPRRLHPISPLFYLIANLRQLVLPLGAGAIAGNWWFLAPTVIIVLGRWLEWLRFTYQIDGDVIRISEGLLVHKQRTLVLDRVQQVDIVSKLRHRVFGVVGLHVDTASGAKGAELELDVVSVREAERLRTLLERHGTRTATFSASAAAPEAVPARAQPPLVAVSIGQLALAGITGAQTLVILSITASLQEVLDFVDVRRFRTLVPEGSESAPVAVAVGLLFLAVVWLGLAAAAMVLTHYDYRVTINGDDFRVTRGLLDRREVGGSLARVQAVRVEQSFIRRVLGFAAVRVQTAAAPGQNVSRIVIPYVPTRDLERVVVALLPAHLDSWPVLARAPRAALGLAALRRVPPTALVAIAVTALLFPWGALALLAIPLAVGAAVLHWRALGHAKQRNTLWARRGALFLETVIVPTSKAQSLRCSSSPLQRRWQLATFRVDVAGAGSTPRLSDAPDAWVEAMTGLVPSSAVADETTVRRARTATG